MRFFRISSLTESTLYPLSRNSPIVCGRVVMVIPLYATFLGVGFVEYMPRRGDTQPILHYPTTPETGGTIVILPLQLRKRKGSSNPGHMNCLLAIYQTGADNVGAGSPRPSPMMNLKKFPWIPVGADLSRLQPIDRPALDGRSPDENVKTHYRPAAYAGVSRNRTTPGIGRSKSKRALPLCGTISAKGCSSNLSAACSFAHCSSVGHASCARQWVAILE